MLLTTKTLPTFHGRCYPIGRLPKLASTPSFTKCRLRRNIGVHHDYNGATFQTRCNPRMWVNKLFSKTTAVSVFVWRSDTFKADQWLARAINFLSRSSCTSHAAWLINRTAREREKRDGNCLLMPIKWPCPTSPWWSICLAWLEFVNKSSSAFFLHLTPEPAIMLIGVNLNKPTLGYVNDAYAHTHTHRSV